SPATTWRQHETQVTANLQATNPGATIGEQVTLQVTNNATGQSLRIRIDNLVPAGTTPTGQPQFQLVDAKFSSVTNLSSPTANLANTLPPNQSQVYQWISSGQGVTVVPHGARASAAGLTPGTPINVTGTVQIHVNSPSGIVIRNY